MRTTVRTRTLISIPRSQRRSTPKRNQTHQHNHRAQGRKRPQNQRRCCPHMHPLSLSSYPYPITLHSQQNRQRHISFRGGAPRRNNPSQAGMFLGFRETVRIRSLQALQPPTSLVTRLATLAQSPQRGHHRRLRSVGQLHGWGSRYPNRSAPMMNHLSYQGRHRAPSHPRARSTQVLPFNCPRTLGLICLVEVIR
jgi:hypothetical protein